MREPVEVIRTGEQAGVPLLAAGAAAREPPQLRRSGLTTPPRSAGNCTVGGTYADGSGRIQAFVINQA
jgi:hypothetical protein